MEEELKVESEETREEQTPEVSEEPVKEEEKASEPSIDALLDHSREIKKEENEGEYFDKIESERTKFLVAYKKQNRISRILIIPIGLAIAASLYLVLFTSLLWTRILGGGILAAAFIFMLIFHSIERKKITTRNTDYVSFILDNLNGHYFADPRFTEMKVDYTDKLDYSEVIAEGVYKQATGFVSRDYVKGLFDGAKFEVADIQLAEQASRKEYKNIFMGKRLSLDNNLHFEGRYVIVNKKSEPVDAPNALEDLFVLHEDDNLVIYGPEKGDYKALFGTKFISAIKNIRLTDDLLNVAVVVWAGHSAAYLSYSDKVIALPLENPLNKEGHDAYTKDLLDILSALSSLNK